VQMCMCVWLRTHFGWKTELVMGNCERSTCVWKLPDCKNESWCSGTVQVGRVCVFEELQTVFNCSVLTFWSAIKFHRE
jgi:hypothetical protein